MRISKWLLALAGALAIPAALPGQTPTEPNPAVAAMHPAGARQGNAAVVPTPTAPALTKADVDSWLDGFVPYAIDEGDIAGAVVVVVKDGQVLTQRGFGHADIARGTPIDPATTMFRPGSTAKLFTWTAVMQLVQAGKLNLDRDVNDYLDFRIPPAFGKPITMRNIMTHTAGFEETAKYLTVSDPARLMPLDAVLKRWVPERIYAPGAMPAYSNYGAALAGYIVQRVSGEPFADYIARHIFAPLGMAHATFAQPLPARFAADMATGYRQASLPAQKYELVSLSPAGSLAASGGDMAKFMIAHLENGGPLLSPATTALMHAPANTPIPGMPAMALGFYHEDRNALDIIGHAGDLNFFHSDLHLYLNQHVGLFMSFNSAGKGGAAHLVRQRLFEQFTDRYFPDPAAPLPTAPTAHADGAVVAGHYLSSRAQDSGFFKGVGLIGGTTVTLNPDDTITVAALTNAAGVPEHWREVGPWQWQQVGGNNRLGALVRDGRVIRLAPAAFAPIIEFVPASPWLNPAWVLPAAEIALGVLLITALAWPVVALVRRRYRYDPAIVGRTLMLHRAARLTAWALVIVYAGWLGLLSVMTNDPDAFDGHLDIWIRLLQLVLIAGIIGTVLTVWNAGVVTGRRWPTRVWSVMVALSALFLVWLALDIHLLTASLNY